MCSLIVILLLVTCISNQVNASLENPNQPIEYAEITRKLTLKEMELFIMLLSPTDTRLQQETKTLLAQYLIAQTAADGNKIRGSSENTKTDSPTTKSPLRVLTTTAPVSSSTTKVTRPTVPPTHVLSQVDKILESVATGNVVGIVDNSLAIRAPSPVRDLVTGILQLVFCNPLDRLFNRCRSATTTTTGTAATNSATGLGNTIFNQPFGLGNRIKL